MTSYLLCVYGALVATSVIAGVFFLNFWRVTRDGFFLWFTSAFWTFAINWALLAYDLGDAEGAPSIYVVRLLGFVQIAVAIAMKNRAAKR